MGKPHPLALRERVVAFVEEGNTHRSSAAHFRVSIKFVNDMVKLKRETGSLDPKPQGRRGHGKLAPVAHWVRELMEAGPALTLDELRAILEREHGIDVHRSSVGELLHRLGLSHTKKTSEPVNRNARMLRETGRSGSIDASLSCATI
ncbi:MAG: transposase [Pseudomonadota bacterium]